MHRTTTAPAAEIPLRASAESIGRGQREREETAPIKEGELKWKSTENGNKFGGEGERERESEEQGICAKKFVPVCICGSREGNNQRHGFRKAKERGRPCLHVCVEHVCCKLVQIAPSSKKKVIWRVFVCLGAGTRSGHDEDSTCAL